MFTNFKTRIAAVIALDTPALPSSHDHHIERDSSYYHYRMLHQQQLQDKFAYERPPFLHLFTPDELKASADHNARPIIVPRAVGMLPWDAGYAECVNSGKSEWNEDQAAYTYEVLKDPTHKYPDLPYLYFGIFDGHAGYGAALAASHQFHHILHEKLVDCIDLLLPREIFEGLTPSLANKSQNVNLFAHPSHFQRSVSKDELIIGALESAFIDMDIIIAQDRNRYRDAGGCTACVSLFINGKMYVANAGDSRAVLCQRKVLPNENKTNLNTTNCDGSEGSFAEPFSFDHTPETERTRLLGLAQYKPHLMGKYYTAMEYAKRPHERDLGQRILCRQGTNKGWTYKTLTRDDLKMPVVTGEGKRSRLLGTLGVTRGFGDHDLLAIPTGTLIKPFLTAQPEVKFRDLTKIVTIPDEHNEDGDFGILVMATDGLWDVSENDAVARTVFQTLHKYPTEKHRYTMVAQELVAKARGKINDYGHWRLADSKAAATVDDISVIVIPVYQYYKEHLEDEQNSLKKYRDHISRMQAIRDYNAKKKALKKEQQQQDEISCLANGVQEMAHVVVEPDADDNGNSTNAVNTEAKIEKIIEEERNDNVTIAEEEKVENDDLDKTLEKFEELNQVKEIVKEEDSVSENVTKSMQSKQHQRKSQRKDKR